MRAGVPARPGFLPQAGLAFGFGRSWGVGGGGCWRAIVVPVGGDRCRLFQYAVRSGLGGPQLQEVAVQLGGLLRSCGCLPDGPGPRLSRSSAPGSRSPDRPRSQQGSPAHGTERAARRGRAEGHRHDVLLTLIHRRDWSGGLRPANPTSPVLGRSAQLTARRESPPRTVPRSARRTPLSAKSGPKLPGSHSLRRSGHSGRGPRRHGPAHHHTSPNALASGTPRTDALWCRRARAQTAGAVARYSCRRIQKQKAWPGSRETTADNHRRPRRLCSLRFRPAILSTHHSRSLRSSQKSFGCHARTRMADLRIEDSPQSTLPPGGAALTSLFRSGQHLQGRSRRMPVYFRFGVHHRGQ